MAGGWPHMAHHSHGEEVAVFLEAMVEKVIPCTWHVVRTKCFAQAMIVTQILTNLLIIRVTVPPVFVTAMVVPVLFGFVSTSTKGITQILVTSKVALELSITVRASAASAAAAAAIAAAATMMMNVYLLLGAIAVLNVPQIIVHCLLVLRSSSALDQLGEHCAIWHCQREEHGTHLEILNIALDEATTHLGACCWSLLALDASIIVGGRSPRDALRIDNLSHDCLRHVLRLNGLGLNVSRLRWLRICLRLSVSRLHRCVLRLLVCLGHLHVVHDSP